LLILLHEDVKLFDMKKMYRWLSNIFIDKKSS